MAKAQTEAVEAQPETATPLVAMTQEQLAALIANLQPQQASPMGGSAKEFADALAQAIEDREMKWKPHEVRRSPQVSVYNPEGETAHPKPKLKCHIYEGSYPIGDPGDNRTLTRAEVEALNSLTPGFFRVEMFDGSTAVVEVRAQLDAKQEIERLWVIFPEGKDKNGYGSWMRIASYCTDERRVRDPKLAQARVPA